MTRIHEPHILGILIALVSVHIIQLAPPAAGLLTSKERFAIMDAHNKVRLAPTPTPCPALAPMMWDPLLAAVAQNYAETCTFDHNDNRHKQVAGAFKAIGENLYFSAQSRQIYDPVACVAAWDKEKVNYNYQRNYCPMDKVCGHYTQVVWSSSLKLGCGSHICQRKTTKSWVFGPTYKEALIVVCNYGPAGNIVGRRPYTTCKCKPCTEPHSSALVTGSSISSASGNATKQCDR